MLDAYWGYNKDQHIARQGKVFPSLSDKEIESLKFKQGDQTIIVWDKTNRVLLTVGYEGKNFLSNTIEGSGGVTPGPGTEGALVYAGDWNANLNIPAIPPASTSNTGSYYIVSVPGNTTIDGETEWKVKDWIVSIGTKWVKVNNNPGTEIIYFTKILVLQSQNPGAIINTIFSDSNFLISGDTIYFGSSLEFFTNNKLKILRNGVLIDKEELSYNSDTSFVFNFPLSVGEVFQIFSNRIL